MNEKTDIDAFLLDAALAGASLPGTMSENVKKQFSDRDYTPEELHGAIDQALRLVSDLTVPGTVQEPKGRVEAVFSSEDQLQAVDDLLDGPRDPGKENLVPLK